MHTRTIRAGKPEVPDFNKPYCEDCDAAAQKWAAHGFVRMTIGSRAVARWGVAAWVAAAIMAAAVSLSVLRIPIQVTDSLIPLLQVQAAPSAAAVFRSYLGRTGFLRPVNWSQIKLLLDVSGGNYFLAFRGFHVLLVVLLFVLFTLAARVRTRTEFLAFTFALTVLTGLHTFVGNVWEAYPINHFLEIAVFCTGALVLAQSKGGWWADLLGGVLFLAAALTLESGLLVWVVFVIARLVGMKGLSWKGIAFVTVLLAGYFYVRFWDLSTGTPGLTERATGFGFGRLEPDEVVERFGASPYLFYLYNVVSSFLSVVLSEPRAGTWDLTARVVRGQIAPGMVVTVFSSLLATGGMAWFAAVRWRTWAARRFEHADQLVLIVLAVAAGNAVICYVYTKDEIMSTAGVFYALAAFAAATYALERMAEMRMSAVRSSVVLLFLFFGGVTWCVRSAGLHYQMAAMTFNIRAEWANVDDWLDDQEATPVDSSAVQLIEDLRTLAIEMPVVNPVYLPRWGDEWFR